LIRFFEKMVTRSATHFFKKDVSAYFVYSLKPGAQIVHPAFLFMCYF